MDVVWNVFAGLIISLTAESLSGGGLEASHAGLIFSEGTSGGGELDRKT